MKWDRQKIVGQRIVEVNLRPFDDGRGGVATDPEIILENGVRLHFTVQETEVGDYGILLGLAVQPRRVPR